jgi:large subunit ribosomal protein L32e
MNKEKLLKFKNNKKAKNPRFIRQDNYKKKKLIQAWRKPRGWDSKQRKRMQGQAIVQPGYGSPKSLKGVHKSGLIIVAVKTLEEIKKINPKEQGIIIAGKLGLKRKLLLIKEAIKANIKLINIKNPEAYVKAKEEMLEKNKQKKEEKESKVKEKETKKEEKESIEDKLSDEEKKKLEKKEIDRLLTKKF